MADTTTGPAPRFAISRDGTPIAFWEQGEGPPLVLVHGAVSDHRRWRIIPLLEPHRTAFLMDRRGRGHSGDAPEWSLEREVEDVVAVVEAAAERGQAVDLLGHSLGGRLALQAAARSPHLRRLVLYEPVITEPPAPQEVVTRMQALLDEGDKAGVVELMMREVVRMPEDELAAIRSQPAWPSRVAAAHTLPRELGAVRTSGAWDPSEGPRVQVPTLLLVGGDSPPHVKDDIRVLREALRSCAVTVIEGQQHVADQLVPELFAKLVLDFLLD
ncbi:MAG: alpha/beta hydrolase [Actinobacteria bacterium]|nr:alpha/beta hydrolase [Actinomycetota bacterium]